MKTEETRTPGDLHFHYSREERLRSANLQKGPEPKGLFRRNRSLAIILLDVIVIVIIFLLLQFVFTPGRSWTRVGDYRIDLNAFVFESDVYTSLVVQRVRMRDAVPRGSESLVAVRFPQSDEVLDVLPSEEGDEIAVSVVFSAEEIDPAEAIEVEVELLGETRTLRTTPDD